MVRRVSAMGDAVRRSAGAIVCALLAIGAGALATTTDPSVQAVVVVALALGGELLVLRIAGAWTPATVIPVATLNLVGLTGFLFYDDIAPDARVSAQFAGLENLAGPALPLFLVAAGCFTVGTAVAYVATSSRRRQGGDPAEAVRRVQMRSGPLLAVGLIPLLLLVYGRGEALLRSPSYLASSGPTVAVSVGNSLTLVALLALSFVVVRRERGRLLALAALAAWAVVLFAGATRYLALMPAIVLVARYLSPTGRSTPARWVVAAGAATLVLLQLVLTLRQGAGPFGLWPFWDRVLLAPAEHLVPSPAALFGNVLFAVPLAGVVATVEPPLPDGTLWTSITPALGGMTDWPLIYRSLRINQFTPYSGLGELGNHGWPVLVVYMLAAGALFGVLSGVATRLGGVRSAVATIALTGLSALSVLNLMQYNLRSGTRLLWYGLALVALLWLTRGRTPPGEAVDLDRRVSRHASSVGPNRRRA